MSLLFAANSYADDKSDGGDHRPSVGGPIFDIAHFDVLPLAPPQVPADFEQIAYTALFAFRDASRSDPGSESFRVVNWVLAPNHSQIIDVWNNVEAFEQHLARPHSVDFRFNVQGNFALGVVCCIGSPIDDRQYSLVRSFNTPWTSNNLPSTVGPNGALFVVTYADFLLEALEEGDPDRAQDRLTQYGSATAGANGKHLLNYTVLQQLDRRNRFAILEVWDTQANYTSWQGSTVTKNFLAEVTPLLGSPFDHRLNILCGETYVTSIGCTPP